VNPGQNSVWLQPFRIENYISASTLLQMISFTGTFTSAVTAQWGMTMDWMLYSQNTASTTKFESLWSTQLTASVWNSGTSSNSMGYNGSSTSSAANIISASFAGFRMLTAAIGSVLPPKIYALGIRMSTSSVAYSALMRTYGIIFDAPASTAKGYPVGATATSRGYQDGGVFSVTSAAMPASFGLSEIRQMNDLALWCKIGAI
jgi:hypothetical protein